MPKRNSPNELQGLDDLSRLDEIIIDKRNLQRADAKKNRRNRHYGRQFIRNVIGRVPAGDGDVAEALDE